MSRGQRYDHDQIERKWQSCWAQEKSFEVHEDPQRPKFYILDMLPYPSGAGLHVGHLIGYVATDILARFKKQEGFNVLHPMGWDSFGLPAEQYAVRTGTHPRETTRRNVATYRRQMDRMGLGYDWSREITTSAPDYYKWTQWIFTKLYEQGLAYEAEAAVNYCPALRTVLANEEVEEGKSREGGYPVERRRIRQWMLKITAYADRLLEDLDLLDWPANIKELQRSWIGRSEGAEVSFELEGHEEKIGVFTTRPDTLFGVTYLVLAPEHPLLDQITPAENKSALQAYREEVARKSDLERTELNQEKSGLFTGAYALHPLTGESLPIWVADYVLLHYGTGAVMGVPAHDSRDFAFAQKWTLPIRAVIDPDPQEVLAAVEEQEGVEEYIKRCREGIVCWTGGGRAYQSSVSALSLDGKGSEEAIHLVSEWLEKQGKGERRVSYRLRDWLFSRQRYWGEPMPILHYADGAKRVLDLDELPLLPPELEDYHPSEGGESPLAKVKEWVAFVDPKDGRVAQRETNTMPQWAGSCWYYLRYCDPKNSRIFCDPAKERYWLPVDLYVGGAEHAVLHLLYARFWHKVLYDLELVSTKEPFQRLVNQGLVTHASFKHPGGGYVAPEEAEQVGDEWIERGTGAPLLVQVEKMSKSKLNTVSPDEVIEDFGADAIRLYAMFMGPLEKEKSWNTGGVNGCRRFLQRVYDFVHSDCLAKEAPSESILGLVHRCIAAVRHDLERLQFNTAIAKMMEFSNHLQKEKFYPVEVVELLIRSLYPFAPHLAEELWEVLGHSDSLVNHPFPQADERYLVQENSTYIIQINGKLRGLLELPQSLEEGEVVSRAKMEERIEPYLEGKRIQRVIFVPHRLVNFVVG